MLLEEMQGMAVMEAMVQKGAQSRVDMATTLLTLELLPVQKVQRQKETVELAVPEGAVAAELARQLVDWGEKAELDVVPVHP
jgi:hypothetical protein